MPQTPKGYIESKRGGLACDVSVCLAACCRAMSFRPDKPGPCEYLTDRYTCKLHEVGGPNCKPMGCHLYPRNQADIDGMNAQLETAGIKERCILRFN